MLSKSMLEFWKTKRILTPMVMGSLGWEGRIHKIEITTGPQVFLYLHDKATKWTWTCAVPRDLFQNACASFAKAYQKNPTLVTSARSGVASYTYQGATSGLPSTETGDWEQQLGILLTSYACTTKTFEQSNGMQDGGHFVVISYRKHKQTACLLRPFSMGNTQNTILPVEALNDAIHQVFIRDQAAHPEWF